MSDRRVLNRDLWNKWTSLHVDSPFYELDAFRNGASTLKKPELELLGDVSGKRILHLQCHFGLDSLSLSRMGAHVTGVDLSDEAVRTASKLASELDLDAQFICADVLEMDGILEEEFDIVFTSYGVLIWLDDLDDWANSIVRRLKPNGRFILVEFHPLGNLFDETFTNIQYTYFRREAVIEDEAGSYGAPEATDVKGRSMTWDFSLHEVLEPLLAKSLCLNGFKEYDYSPYNLYANGVETDDGWQDARLKDKIPYLFSLDMVKPEFYSDLQ